jgi:hypothetical protein
MHRERRKASLDDRGGKRTRCACWPGVRRRASKAESALMSGRGGAHRSRLDPYGSIRQRQVGLDTGGLDTGVHYGCAARM